MNPPPFGDDQARGSRLAGRHLRIIGDSLKCCRIRKSRGLQLRRLSDWQTSWWNGRPDELLDRRPIEPHNGYSNELHGQWRIFLSFLSFFLALAFSLLSVFSVLPVLCTHPPKLGHGYYRCRVLRGSLSADTTAQDQRARAGLGEDVARDGTTTEIS